MALLIASYLICFTILTWRRFHLGLALLFFLLPTYLIRFHLGPLPTTLLEVMIWIIIIIFFIETLKNKNIKTIFQTVSLIAYRHVSLSIAISLFLLAATISIFTSVDTRAALGEWKAFYVEPFLLFLVVALKIRKERYNNITIKQKNGNGLLYCYIDKILLALTLCGLATSLLTIYQHFTGWLVPSAFWENGNSYRVTAWYGFPNAVGLYLAPLYPLAIYLLGQRFNIKKRNGKWEMGNGLIAFSLFSFLISAPFAVLFAKSTGAIVGLAAGLAMLLILHRQTRWPAIIIGLISLIGLISPISPFRQELLLQNRSGQIRVAMWGEAVELLRERPLLGAGLASYQERVTPYHTTVNGEGIEIFHHPHNIFLTMYINLGLFGLIGFVWILVWFYRTGFKNLSPIAYRLSPSSHTLTHNTLIPFLLSSMTVVLIHGLVDSPYIKNDLAILFWLLPALLLIDRSQTKTV